MRALALALLAACAHDAPPIAPTAPPPTPPPSICADATTLRTYDIVDARVTFTDQVCAAGCVANACSVARTCTALPVVMTDVGNLDAPILAPERDYLYVAGRDRIVRWNTHSGVVDVLSETGGRALAIDSSYIYWVAGLSSSSILRAPRAGGPSTSLVDDRQQIISLAVDDHHIYWTELDVNNTSHNGIWRIAQHGGPIEAFAPNQRGATSVVLDSTHVYWTDQFEDRVMRKPKAGGPVDTLAASQDGASFIALDDRFVYWVARDQIGRVPKTGGTVDSFPALSPTGLAVADGELVWTSNSDVYHRAAGVTASLAHGTSHTFDVSMGPKHVYWVTTYPERVMRMPFPCEP